MKLDELKVKLSENHYDAIVVEGYDGVGKGRILNELSEYYGVVPYRPDYNLWQKYDHRKYDRWKVAAFFFDTLKHFQIHPEKTMLFDRGVVSGAIYNDERLLEDYPKMIEGLNILHVLVTCSKWDYLRFLKNRGLEFEDFGSLEEEVSKYIHYTERYIEAFENSDLSYVILENVYDSTIDTNVCSSCGHYSYGYCMHPLKQCFVDPNCNRCNLSKDKEVQDLDDSKMQCV